MSRLPGLTTARRSRSPRSWEWVRLTPIAIFGLGERARRASGGLQVGPQSAGDFPGPLFYDLGDTEPTVADANVILGFLNPTQLAGGAFAK